MGRRCPMHTLPLPSNYFCLAPPFSDIRYLSHTTPLRVIQALSAWSSSSVCSFHFTQHYYFNFLFVIHSGCVRTMLASLLSVQELPLCTARLWFLRSSFSESNLDATFFWSRRYIWITNHNDRIFDDDSWAVIMKHQGPQRARTLFTQWEGREGAGRGRGRISTGHHLP